ncbi:aryl-alcohol dehydrogenase-like predicted oxidoreductase [Streptomyces sp. LBL]|nr:aryl-alcohol dehydrogenase-like predicted oxidoreductase [Streptomyces sp. LBL]
MKRPRARYAPQKNGWETMKHVMLGDLEVSRIGLGVMTASHGCTGKNTGDAEAIRAVHRALELGVTFIDTAEVYGPFLNEELVGRALKGRRDQAVVATKFGFVSHTGREGMLDSSPANVRAALEGSLKRLGTDHVDLLYQHRVDPEVPIEETVGAMAELVKEGKVGHLGLSEAGPIRALIVKALWTLCSFSGRARSGYRSLPPNLSFPGAACAVPWRA